ncbi:hypothetical protein LTR08_003328 [Meristemomyces frigidus]|nr:hypothetical protein LTR08_003328 [Meristemomyces frigidus]
MAEQPALESIDAATFASLLTHYPALIVGEKLPDLEEQRMETIPEALRQREMAFITRDELIVLMDWKISHGKKRPALPKLIAKNDPMTVKSTSIECFRLYHSDSTKPPTEDQIKHMIDILARLSGVGPATASLLLSVYDLTNVPFFSDELYRWAMWNEPATPKGSGWQREIKYTAKDYLQLYPRVQELRGRLSAESGAPVSALDVEKVAYVLGKRASSPGTGERPSRKRKASPTDGTAPAKRQKSTASSPPTDITGVDVAAPTDATTPAKPKKSRAKKPSTKADGDEPPALTDDAGPAKPKKSRVKKLPTGVDGDELPPLTDATAPAKLKKPRAKKTPTDANGDGLTPLTDATAPAKPKKPRAKKAPTDANGDELTPLTDATAPAKPKKPRAKKTSTDDSGDPAPPAKKRIASVTDTLDEVVATKKVKELAATDSTKETVASGE